MSAIVAAVAGDKEQDGWLMCYADLSAAVDVYSEWVDACDAVAQGTGDADGGEHAPARAPIRPGGAKPGNEDDDDDADDIIDDEDDQIGYGGEGVAADDEY